MPLFFLSGTLLVLRRHCYEAAGWRAWRRYQLARKEVRQRCWCQICYVTVLFRNTFTAPEAAVPYCAPRFCRSSAKCCTPVSVPSLPFTRHASHAVSLEVLPLSAPRRLHVSPFLYCRCVWCCTTFTFLLKTPCGVTPQGRRPLFFQKDPLDNTWNIICLKNSLDSTWNKFERSRVGRFGSKVRCGGVLMASVQLQRKSKTQFSKKYPKWPEIPSNLFSAIINICHGRQTYFPMLRTLEINLIVKHLFR